MRKSTISLAVAAALAAGSAQAAVSHVYASGASAQRNVWARDISRLCGTSGSPALIDEYDANINKPDGVTKPDFKAFVCIAVQNNLGGFPSGNTVILHYSAELGSVWGILPALVAAGSTVHHDAENQGKRLAFDPSAGGTVSLATPSGHVGTNGLPDNVISNIPAHVVDYVYGSDSVAFTTGGSSSDLVYFSRQQPDLATADIEPAKWSNPDNWPAYSVFGHSPDDSELSLLSGDTMIGQVFEVAVAKDVPTIFATPRLSKTSISAIFQGKVSVWGQIPEVNNASDTTPIRVCRRDHGSGTQVSASITFTGTECSAVGSRAFVSQDDPGSIGTVVENPSTSAMQNCLKTQVGGLETSIGFFNVGADTADYKAVSIDGVVPNSHNAAAGFYPFAYETWATKLTNNTGVQTLYDDLKDQANLTAVASETASLSGGQFVVTSGNPQAYFGLQNWNTPSISALTASPGAPVAVYSRSGDSCVLPRTSF